MADTDTDSTHTPRTQEVEASVIDPITGIAHPVDVARPTPPAGYNAGATPRNTTGSASSANATPTTGSASSANPASAANSASAAGPASSANSAYCASSTSTAGSASTADAPKSSSGGTGLIIAGVIVLILGIAMLVLPGPGILGIIVGVILIIQGRKRSAIGRKSK